MKMNESQLISIVENSVRRTLNEILSNYPAGVSDKDFEYGEGEPDFVVYGEHDENGDADADVENFLYGLKQKGLIDDFEENAEGEYDVYCSYSDAADGFEDYEEGGRYPAGMHRPKSRPVSCKARVKRMLDQSGIDYEEN